MGEATGSLTGVRRAGVVAGPVLGALLYTLLARGGLAPAACATAGIGALMATWWLTEALPLEATALVPLAAFPLLGVCSVKAAAAPYADPVIFLFMGGLMLGLAMERWGLHRRIALRVLSLVGTRPAMLVGGVMLATAMISMWVSNTATAVMMLPIGMSIVAMVEAPGPAGAPSAGRPPDFATPLMLGIAYASSIGGVGTVVGSPPNAVLVLQARELGAGDVSFTDWLGMGVPTVALFLPIAWLVLTRIVHRVSWAPQPVVRERLAAERAALGPITGGERAVLVVFLLTASLWILREPVGRATGLIRGDGATKVELLTDPGIAILGALALFLLPVRDAERRRVAVLDWPTAARLPWGVLLLFGGGLSLAEAMTASDLDQAIGGALAGLGGLPPMAVILLVTAIVVFLTEVASNTAIATTFIPIAYAAARPLGLDPLMLMVPVALGASYAFMMPMGTPPNALVFASGRVTVRQMARAGVILNLLAIAAIAALTALIGPWLFGAAPAR